MKKKAKNFLIFLRVLFVELFLSQCYFYLLLRNIILGGIDTNSFLDLANVLEGRVDDLFKNIDDCLDLMPSWRSNDMDYFYGYLFGEVDDNPVFKCFGKVTTL